MNSTVEFENARWTSFHQGVEFRHRAALDLVANGPVLDVGCGDGLFLKMLAAKGIGGTGVDVSAKAVEQCRAQSLNAFMCELNEKLPFEDNSFEVVMLLDVLEHTFFPEALLKEAARVSRDGVVLSVPNFSSLPARLQMFTGEVPENNRINKGHIYWFNYSVLRALVANAGLEMVRTSTNSFWPHLTRSLVRLWPSVFALSFVSLCKLKPNFIPEEK